MTTLTIGNKTVSIDDDEWKENTCFDNLYYVEKGRGSCLTYGLRKFNQFFEKRIFGCQIQQNNFKETALQMAKFSLGIAVYPPLGTLALPGILINKIHVHTHNQKIQRVVQRLIESGCFMKYTYENPLFSSTPGTNELRHTYKRKICDTGQISNEKILSCRKEGLSNLKEYVETANKEGRFIKKFSFEYDLNYEWMAAALKFELVVTEHYPESQFLRKKTKEIGLTLFRANEITLESLPKE